jgi:hypothetical protein
MRLLSWYNNKYFSDRRLMQILIVITVVFSFITMSSIHLVHLHTEQQQPHPGTTVTLGTSNDHAAATPTTTTTGTVTKSIPKLISIPTVTPRQSLQRQNRHQQTSLQQWLLEDQYHNYDIHQNNNAQQKQDNQMTIDPVQHYRTIFCPVSSSSVSLSSPEAEEMNDDDPHSQRRRTRRKRQRRRPVMLWGIPSTTSEIEIQRRKVLRSTYLNYYKLLDDTINNNNNNNQSSVDDVVPNLSDVDQNLTIQVLNRRHEVANSTNSTRRRVANNTNRICSFHEWTCNHTSVRDVCQLIYVFFVGGGDPQTAPSEIVQLDDDDGADPASSSSSSSTRPNFRSMLFTGDQVLQFNPQPLTTDDNTKPTTVGATISSPLPPHSSRSQSLSKLNATWIDIDKYEPGVVYLNIRENQFDGKMTTWFQFASLVNQEFEGEIDYVVKVDSDLLLFTPNFLDWIESSHEQIQQRRRQHHHRQVDDLTLLDDPPPLRVYGGVEFPNTNCELNATYDHDCPLPLVGRSYMSGELNFMSMDLAQYIVSKYCPRPTLTIPHEDVSLSNYVYSYETNTQYHHRHHHHVKEGTTIDTSNHTIEIMSVLDKNIMLTRSSTADWWKFDLTTSERFLDIVWGHSIRRGRYKQYLVFKQDKTFVLIWSMFLMRYLSLLGLTLPSNLQPKSTRSTSSSSSSTNSKIAALQTKNRNRQTLRPRVAVEKLT